MKALHHTSFGPYLDTMQLLVHANSILKADFFAGGSLFGSAAGFLDAVERDCVQVARVELLFPLRPDSRGFLIVFPSGTGLEKKHVKSETVRCVDSEASGSTASPFGGGSGSRLSLQATDAELRRLIGPTAAPTAQDRIKRPLWWL